MILMQYFTIGKATLTTTLLRWLNAIIVDVLRDFKRVVKKSENLNVFLLLICCASKKKKNIDAGTKYYWKYFQISFPSITSQLCQRKQFMYTEPHYQSLLIHNGKIRRCDRFLIVLIKYLRWISFDFAKFNFIFFFFDDKFAQSTPRAKFVMRKWIPTWPKRNGYTKTV